MTTSRASCIVSELRGYGVSRLVLDVDRRGCTQITAEHNARKHGRSPELVITGYHDQLEDALAEACTSAHRRGWKDGEIS